MLETLSGLLNYIVLVFAVSSMLLVGSSYTIHEILQPLKNLLEVGKAILANFLFTPLLGYLIIQVIPMDKPLQVGILLIACAAGAPFLIKLTIAAGRDASISTSLLVLLLPVTIIYLPVVLPLVIPEISISAMAIAVPLVATMLLPLAIGFLVKAYLPHWAIRLQPFLGKLSTVALLLLILMTFLVNSKSIVNMFGTGVIGAAAILILGAFTIGYFLGGPGIEEKDILGLGTAQRNIAAATVVATQGFENRSTLIVIVLTSLLTLIILFPVAILLRKREKKKITTDPENQEGLL